MQLFPCGWYSPRAFGALRWRPVWSHGAIKNPTSAARLVIPSKLDLRVSGSGLLFWDPKSKPRGQAYFLVRLFQIFGTPPLAQRRERREKDAELRILTSGLLFAMGLASGAEVRCTASLARLSLRPMADGEESFRKERKERRESAQSRGSTKESTCPCGDSQPPHPAAPCALRLFGGCFSTMIFGV